MKLYAVIITRRDFTERTVHLDNTEANAYAARDRIAAVLVPAEAIRGRVKPVDWTREQVEALAETWGREDAEAGEERSGANRLDPAWRTAYLRGFNATARAARRSAK